MQLIDHVILAVPDLDAQCNILSSLGFSVSEKSGHEVFGTANKIVVLNNGYIELLTIERQHAPNPVVKELIGPWIADGGGVEVVVIHASDALAAQSRLRMRGISCGDVSTFSRPALTDNGLAEATFSTFFVEPDSLDGFGFIYCQHHTPELIYQSRLMSHRNSSSRLKGVVRYVAAPKSFTDFLVQQFGNDNVARNPNSIAINQGDQVIEYRAIDDLESNVSDWHLRSKIGRPISILQIEVNSLHDIVRITEEHSDYTLLSSDNQRLLLGADVGNMLLEFSERS